MAAIRTTCFETWHLSPICNPCCRCIQAKYSPPVCTLESRHIFKPFIALFHWSFYHGHSLLFHHFLSIKCQNMTPHCFLGLWLNGIRFLNRLIFALFFSLRSTWASFFKPLPAGFCCVCFFCFFLSQWQQFCDWLNAIAGPKGGWNRVGGKQKLQLCHSKSFHCSTLHDATPDDFVCIMVRE